MAVEQEALDAVALSRDEYDLLVARLGREPNDVELGMFGSLWSEHCGYKNSRPLLRRFPSGGDRVLTRVGEENAGAIDIGDGWAVVMKVESHNHPSAIEPYEGAATGVGGIVRDIFAMGAYPIALLDSLRFGPLDEGNNRYLFEGVVGGIGGYGNCLGIPTVGGEVVVGGPYNGNPLVNAMCVGLVRADGIVSARASGEGNALLLVGADTGRDGIHGASGLASRTDPEARFEEMRPAVQVGNPFLEKMLMEACFELASEHRDWIVGLQDLGAAGLTSSVLECCARGEAGAVLNLECVPRRESGMTPYEVMLSESQERMLVIAKREHVADVEALFERWEVDCIEIGQVTDGDEVVLREDGVEVGRVPVEVATEAPAYTRDGQRSLEALARSQANPGAFPDLRAEAATEALVALIQRPNLASKAEVFRQYDHQVLTNTVVAPGGDAAVLRVPGTTRGIAVATDGNGRYCQLDAHNGGAIAVAEAARNVVCTGARPVAVTDCLNFGAPENLEVYATLAGAVDGISAACEAFGTPVVSGNVSLYNESGGAPVWPTPVIGMLGVLEDVQAHLGAAFERAGAQVWLLGGTVEQAARTLAGSEYLEAVHGAVIGTPTVDLEAEARLHDLVLGANDAGLLLSAHDCSDGGLAVALAECCLLGGYGFAGEVEVEGRIDAALFGEGQGRIVVSARPEAGVRLAALAEEMGVPATRLGVTTDEGVLHYGPVEADLDEVREAWESGLGL
ncbi:MAG: phosphoribosylformylglycinamidine synthase subunit PurL [Chloroflexi bacterium]|nr:phosphoribosylformylglycinamidine synthase subunit PurL [Chloroflexota bacterium]